MGFITSQMLMILDMIPYLTVWGSYFDEERYCYFKKSTSGSRLLIDLMWLVGYIWILQYDVKESRILK